VTGENISGANTPGYVRRRALLETRIAGNAIAGGAQFKGTQRVFDRFLYGSVVRETGLRSAADSRSRALTHTEAMLAPEGAKNLGDSVASFFAAYNDLALKADDPTARRQVQFAAEDVARGFNESNDRLVGQRTELLVQAQGVAGEINERLDKIATLNTKIAEMQSREYIGSERGSSGRAELMDQRDELVREVAERIDLSVVPGKGGSVTLLSGGSSLITDGEMSAVQVSADPSNNLVIELTRDGAVSNITTKVRGGELGGLLEARDTDIVDMLNDLDQMAFDFANAVNVPFNAGQDLDGDTGFDLFTDPTGAALAAGSAAVGITVNPVDITGVNDIVAGAVGQGVGSNAAALAIVEVGEGSDPGLGVPAERWGAIAGRLGIKLSAASGDFALRDSTLAQSEHMRDSVSGVSLDEEMINLTKFQRAFDASMRVLQAADEMLTTLLQRL